MFNRVIFLAGKKRAGKDTVADRLVSELGYTKFQISDPWVKIHLWAMGVEWDEYQAHKPLYRAEIQRRATLARAENPGVILDILDRTLTENPTVPFAVTGVRFINEALYGIQHGHFVVKVECPDEVRRQRFIDSGERLDLFDDPFEREVDLLPWHLLVDGDIHPSLYVPLLRAGYHDLKRKAAE